MNVKQRKKNASRPPPRTYTRKCEWDNFSLPYFPSPLEIEMEDERNGVTNQNETRRVGRPFKSFGRQILKWRVANLNACTADGSRGNMPRPSVVATSGQLALASPFCKGGERRHKQQKVFIHASMLYYLIPGDNVARVVCPVSSSVNMTNIFEPYSSSCSFCYPCLIPGIQYYEEFHLNPPVLEERGYGDDVRYTPHSSAIYLTTPSLSAAQLSSAIVNGGGYFGGMDDNGGDADSDILVSSKERQMFTGSFYGHTHEADSTRSAINMVDSDESGNSSSSSSDSVCADEGHVCDANPCCDGSSSLPSTPRTKRLRKKLSLLKILSRAARKEIFVSYKDKVCRNRGVGNIKESKRPKISELSESAKCRSDIASVPSQHSYFRRNTKRGHECHGLGGAGGSIVKDVCTQVSWDDLPIPPVHHFVHFLQRPSNPPSTNR